MCHRGSWTCLGPSCQHSEGKPWGQGCDLRHVSTLSEPQFSLLSKGEMASTSLRASSWDKKSRRKVPSHLHRKPLEGCFDSAGPHPRSQSSETILWKESKHPEGSRAQERSSGAWLLARLPQSSCHHGCTSARPICLPGTFPRLGGGAWALLETDPLPLWTWSIVPGSGE